MHIAATLAGIEHEREREPLLRADCPTLFESVDFDVSPRADFLCLRSFDAE
jgi:hypothetical protein